MGSARVAGRLDVLSICLIAYTAASLFHYYGLLGLDGLGHYLVAPLGAHTMLMNFSIGLEVATALMLLTAVAHGMLTVMRQRASRI